AQGPAAAARCSELLGKYVAARLAEQSEGLAHAAQYYADAYLQSVAQGDGRPALAREAALRFAERGPGPGSTLAVALAAAAAQDEDPDGSRAVERVRGLAYAEPVRSVDAGSELRVSDKSPMPLSLRAALADEPWDPGLYLEARPGQTAQTSFVLTQAL